MFGEHKMLKLNKYILSSIFLTLLLVACGGGGGGGSNPSGQNDLPAESPPTEIPPAESSPVISVTNSLVGPGNVVTAGQNFTITARLTNQTTTTVTFSNAVGTPGSITYNPASCELTSAKNSCTTTVSVALNTPSVAIHPGYSTAVSYTGAVSAIPNITFAVVQPALSVYRQPILSAIPVGDTTNIGFTIAASSIPAGQGKIDVTLSSSSFNIVNLSSLQCEIPYNNGQIITPNTCTNIVVTGVNPGSSSIQATSTNFTGATTNPVVVMNPIASPQPSFVAIPIFNNNTGVSSNVFAGQSFQIKVTSNTTSAETIYFSNETATPPSVITKTNHGGSSCSVSATTACYATVSIGLSTLATKGQTYAINLSYVNSDGVKVNVGKISFAVTKPTLIVTKQLSVGTLLSDRSGIIGFSIPGTQVPEGSGSITINLSSSNVLSLNPSCSLTYSGGLITGGSCDSVTVTATRNTGISAVRAVDLQQYFTAATTNPIAVPYHLAYFLLSDTGNISMSYELSNGVLGTVYPQPITQTVPNNQPVGSNSIKISPTRNNVYVTNAFDNIVRIYNIDQNNGSLVLQGTAPTESTPVALTFESGYAFVTNYSSSSISPYKLNVDGSLTPLKVLQFAKSLPTSALVFTPNGKNAYVLGYPYNIFMFNNKGNGILTSTSPASIATPSGSGNLRTLVVSPNGNFVYVVDVSGRVYLYKINNSNGVLSYSATIDVQAEAQQMTFDPTGEFVYISSNSVTNIYNFNALNGELTLLINPTTLPGAYSYPVTFDPSGQYAYMAPLSSNLQNTIFMYNTQINGTLTSLIPGNTAQAQAMGVVFR